MPAIAGDSSVNNVPAVKGTNTAGGDAVAGQATGGGNGVVGISDTFYGVHGESDSEAGVLGHSKTHIGVVGEGDAFDGVWGTTKNGSAAGVSGHNDNGTAVWGGSKIGFGVHGESDSEAGVHGHSNTHIGVVGEGDTGDGVWGTTKNGSAAGVSGHNDNGTAVWGGSKIGFGVHGESDSEAGVHGHSKTHIGVVGESDAFDGVWGMSHSPDHAGVSAHNDKGGLAAYFEGNVTVTGDINLAGADCAEQFDIAGAETIEAGNVVVIDQEGALRRSQNAYDKKVAGVISGAGEYRPGLVLDRQQSKENRLPVALVGKVYCKVDAQYSPIDVGDMLTSSPTPGHAMKASDPVRAFGSVIGKALRPLAEGQGLIPVLVALQ